MPRGVNGLNVASKLTAIGFKISLGDEEGLVVIRRRLTNEICCIGIEKMLDYGGEFSRPGSSCWTIVGNCIMNFGSRNTRYTDMTVEINIMTQWKNIFRRLC